MFTSDLVFTEDGGEAEPGTQSQRGGACRFTTVLVSD